MDSQLIQNLEDSEYDMVVEELQVKRLTLSGIYGDDIILYNRISKGYELWTKSTSCEGWVLLIDGTYYEFLGIF